jgi:hypothetical protein
MRNAKHLKKMLDLFKRKKKEIKAKLKLVDPLKGLTLR